jgi:ribokinase
MARPKVTVVGSFAVGLTIRTPTIPVFGMTTFGSDFDMGPGGKGSNQAVALARLGMDSVLGGIIGRDKLSDIALDLYAREGVDASLVRQSDARQTGVGFIILNKKGDNFIILDMGANTLMDEAFVDSLEPRIAQSDVVMTVLEIPVVAAVRAMELGRRHGAITILNPAPAAPIPESVFPHVDYLTPNESELRILLGLRPDDPRPSLELVGMLRARGVRNVIVTLGSRGVLVATNTIETVVPAAPIDVIDTTGAGDSFNAGFASALAEGRDLIEAVRFGTACGALVCTTLGVIPGLPFRQAADALFNRLPPNDGGTPQ